MPTKRVDREGLEYTSEYQITLVYMIILLNEIISTITELCSLFFLAFLGSLPPLLLFGFYPPPPSAFSLCLSPLIPLPTSLDASPPPYPSILPSPFSFFFLTTPRHHGISTFRHIYRASSPENFHLHDSGNHTSSSFFRIPCLKTIQ